MNRLVIAKLPQTLKELALHTSDRSWHELFSSHDVELERIEQMLLKLQQQRVQQQLPEQAWLYTPAKPQLFRTFRETVLDEVKVLIIGMDPYPGFYPDGKPIACGVAFMAERTIPKSLENIFAELKRSLPEFNRPLTGDLSKWCRQGVLLLNASLTHLPSHSESKNNTQKELWLPIVYRVLEAVTTRNKNIAICLWGRDAQGYDKHISGTHLILKSSHPSPLSAYKGPDPFIGNNHFVKINEHLEKTGRTAVDWSL